MDFVKKHPAAALAIVFLLGVYAGPKVGPKLAGIPVVGKLV